MSIKAGLVSGEVTELSVSKLVGFAADDDLTITETIASPLDTFVITNGVKTKTIVINSATLVTTITWS